MNKNLRVVFQRSLEIIKKDSRCLGGWHFGSISRGLEDDLSDVDPVFLIEDKYFDDFAEGIPNIFEQICDKVILIWPEDFNSHMLKNFGILLMEENNIFQYDIFLINYAYRTEHFCQIHYTGCNNDDILFDKNGVVKELFENQEEQSIPSRNILQLIDKYWFHCNMLVKYYRRNDIFKLQSNIQHIFHTHTQLLLSKYQRTTWGGWESLIKYNIPQNKQKNLAQYFCSADLAEIRATIYRVVDSFSRDAKELCRENGIEYPEEIEALILSEFKKYVP